MHQIFKMVAHGKFKNEIMGYSYFLYTNIIFFALVFIIIEIKTSLPTI